MEEVGDQKGQNFLLYIQIKNQTFDFGCFASEPFTFNFALRIWLSVDCVKAFTVYFGLPVDVEVRAGDEERHADSKRRIITVVADFLFLHSLRCF